MNTPIHSNCPTSSIDDNNDVYVDETILQAAETMEVTNVTNNTRQPQHYATATTTAALEAREIKNLNIVFQSAAFDDDVSDYRNGSVYDNDGRPRTATAATSTCRTTTSNTSSSRTTTSTGTRATWGKAWTMLINEYVRKPILLALLFITSRAARYPRTVVGTGFFLAVGLAISGYLNLSIEIEADVVWTPVNSKTALHKAWLRNDSDFTGQTRPVVMIFHSHGDNVLNHGKRAVDKAFEAVDAIRNLADYDEVCAESDSLDELTGSPFCEVQGVTQFWDNSSEEYRSSIQSTHDLVAAISVPTFPSNNIPVPENLIFGYPVRDNSTENLLTSVESFSVVIKLPWTDRAKAFETQILDTILDMNEEWIKENDVVVSVSAVRSLGDEATRAISVDLPLIPLVFVVMSIFTAFVFYQRDKIRSRSFLGFCAVLCVLLSLAASYGVALTAGIPLTSITQVLPFIIFGVGLDDAFIIYGEYRRTDESKSPEERIQLTIEEVGMSITMTTVTSALAFGLGGLSSVRAAQWLACYGLPAVVIDFIYQITWFIACIVLDERRIQQNRRDCCCWVTVASDDEDLGESKNNIVGENASIQGTQDGKTVASQGTSTFSQSKAKSTMYAMPPVDIREPMEKKQRTISNMSEDETLRLQSNDGEPVHAVDRFMKWYARQLLKPGAKMIVLVVFTAFLVMAAQSATKLSQEFEYVDLMPGGSYVADYTNAIDEYTSGGSYATQIIFRDVDQSDPAVQDAMEKYIEDLVGIDGIQDPPEYCWLTHFRMFKSYFNGMTDMSFEEQIDQFLKNDAFYRLHKNNIARNSAGNVTASRCIISMNNVDFNDVHDQVKALLDQRDVTAAQPINQDRDDWAFFTYNGYYDVWEFYSVVPKELVMVTIVGVVSVSAISLFFIPHWTASIFVLPMICILYVDLLGVMQWAGVHVNGQSFVALSMAIGLLVDFVMHTLLSYYEAEGDRQEKTTRMLSTMGSSILLGGASTCLGTLPLAFCTSAALRTVFTVFVSLVALGISHGLVLLPVLLSIIGPQDQIGSSGSSLDHDAPTCSQAEKVIQVGAPMTSNTVNLTPNDFFSPRLIKNDPPGVPLTSQCSSSLCTVKQDPDGDDSACA